MAGMALGNGGCCRHHLSRHAVNALVWGQGSCAQTHDGHVQTRRAGGDAIALTSADQQHIARRQRAQT